MSELQKTYDLTVLPEATPATLLNLAISQGADLDRLEKLMLLQEKWEANQAKKAYTVAMAAFKRNPPDIEKDKKVSFGTTQYNHASLGNVTNKINSALGEHGLSAAWFTEQSDGKVTIRCRITHILGHHEETALTAGPDTSGAKNPIQAIASTISYLERYTILALTGLATHEMDDDGVGTAVEYINEKQLSTLLDLINAKGVDQARFLAYMKTTSVETILALDFHKAINALNAKVVAK